MGISPGSILSHDMTFSSLLELWLSGPSFQQQRAQVENAVDLRNSDTDTGGFDSPPCNGCTILTFRSPSISCQPWIFV